MSRTKAIIGVENVVATGTLDDELDLGFITINFPDTNYNPDRFPGLVFRLEKPKTTILLFRTGKMVCTGAKSEKQAEEAIKTTVHRLKRGGVKIINEATVKIENIVASVNLGGQVHLEESARLLPRSIYEPEQFPGIILRITKPKVVFLIFASGKLVCTGAKNEADIHKAVQHIHNELENKDLMIY